MLLVQPRHGEHDVSKPALDHLLELVRVGSQEDQRVLRLRQYLVDAVELHLDNLLRNVEIGITPVRGASAADVNAQHGVRLNTSR